MSIETELPDADCENCNYFVVSYTESTDQWCYMFKERPGSKCGQFKTVKITPLNSIGDEDDQYYKHIKEHKEQCEADFREQQSEEKWYANSLGDEE